MNAGNPDAAAHNAGDEHSYADFLHGLQARFEARLKEGGDQVFDTTATGLFDDYLAALPAELRQRHTCSCCQNFVRRFGGLVTLAADGRQTPLLWGDPLVAVSIFHPDICSFEKGTVRVETEKENNMGSTIFTPAPNGNVEIARTVDREQFYHILSTTLDS